MGQAKRQMETHDAATAIGIQIGIRAGVLERCDGHEHCWWTTGEDEREAYKVASAMVRDGDGLVAGFDRDEIMDGLKAAIQDAGMDGCSHCASIMDDD